MKFYKRFNDFYVLFSNMSLKSTCDIIFLLILYKSFQKKIDYYFLKIYLIFNTNIATGRHTFLEKKINRLFDSDFDYKISFDEGVKISATYNLQYKFRS